MASESILLVEDEPILRQLLHESLQDDGFSVEVAADADTAWDMVSAGLEFDILVTDVRMPGKLDGLELAQLVHSKRQDIRIVVISGYTSLERFDRRLGIFLKKPFTPAKLSEALIRAD